jgi:hypothetical protein
MLRKSLLAILLIALPGAVIFSSPAARTFADPHSRISDIACRSFL